MPVQPQVDVFARLLQVLQLDPRLAVRAANFVAASQPLPPDGGNGSQPVARNRTGMPMKLLQADDLLAVQGFTPAVVQKLRPFVVVLPGPTQVNANTASAEVLAAVIPNSSLSEGNALVARRKTAPWRGLNYLQSELNGRTLDTEIVDVKSEYFLVISRIRLDRAALDAESLIQRKLSALGGTKVMWTRQL